VTVLVFLTFTEDVHMDFSHFFIYFIPNETVVLIRFSYFPVAFAVGCECGHTCVCVLHLRTAHMCFIIFFS
jgi:hypothetical protein